MAQADFATFEIQLFFKFSAELRALSRKANPNAMKRRELLDELASIAKNTTRLNLAERCREILDSSLRSVPISTV